MGGARFCVTTIIITKATENQLLPPNKQNPNFNQQQQCL